MTTPDPTNDREWVTARLTDALTDRVPAEHIPAAIDAIFDAFPHVGFERLREFGAVGVLSLSARVEVRWRDGRWVEYRPDGGNQ